MDGKNRGKKRTGLRVNSEVDFPLTKTRRQATLVEKTAQAGCQSQPSPGTPKGSKQKASCFRSKTLGEGSVGKNNNAQLANVKTTPKKKSRSTPGTDFQGPYEGDHVNVQVRDSEDEFLDNENSQGDEIPYNQDSGSDVESEGSKSDQSEVVISEETKRTVERARSANKLIKLHTTRTCKCMFRTWYLRK